jgi:hypothetical protein
MPRGWLTQRHGRAGQYVMFGKSATQLRAHVALGDVAPLDSGYFVFPQDRDLNRGWSEEGKRYRALEREIGASPGRFFFCRLIYTDETDFPTWVELGTLRSGAPYVGRFRNRFD